MSEILDLFGDPIPEGHGKRGRPPHVVTNQNRNKVIMLLALGWSNERIASAISVTLPTLRKHYFSQLKVRDIQRDRLMASLAMRLWTQVEAGNVTGMREFQRFLDRNDGPMKAGDQEDELDASDYSHGREVASWDEDDLSKLGKKAAASIAAGRPDVGSPLGALMARRQKHGH
ncbi:MAG: hypothetical protein AB7V13_21110 [Pseudorhodoplanes sp.]|uniref:hypothetical protein n=1 Tax=Pseudorhodoplanes sp. TaxID=1934341 RepID=UPI003D0BAA0E